MKPYPHVTYALKTIFSVESGLSDDEMIRMYRRSVEAKQNINQIRKELDSLLGDPSVSWIKLLRNDEYEVYDAESETDARDYALRMLVAPLKGL